MRAAQHSYTLTIEENVRFQEKMHLEFFLISNDLIQDGQQ